MNKDMVIDRLYKEKAIEKLYEYINYCYQKGYIDGADLVLIYSFLQTGGKTQKLILAMNKKEYEYYCNKFSNKVYIVDMTPIIEKLKQHRDEFDWGLEIDEETKQAL